jgi:predicted RNase H-like HicB family nuclease
MKNFIFNILIEKSGDVYTALCLDLDIASEGKTIKEAKQNIQDAINLYIQTVIKKGWENDFIPRPAPIKEWQKFLRARAINIQDGLVKKRSRKSIPKFSIFEKIYIG